MNMVSRFLILMAGHVIAVDFELVEELIRIPHLVLKVIQTRYHLF
jgi:hypothetical protein